MFESKFFLLTGHHLCRAAWLKYLGVGKQRILRTKRKFRGVDERTLNQGVLVEVHVLAL